MKVTRETDYSIRAMIFLKNNPDRLSTLGEIADGVRAPHAFMSKVLQSLSRSKLIASRKGKAGGFLLAAPAESITLGDIVHAACGEGPLIQTTCRRGGAVCPLNAECKVHRVWEGISRSMETALRSAKLSSL